MTQSLLWFEEEEERQEYIAEWFSDAVDFKRTDTIKEYRTKIINILQKKIDGEYLTSKQKDLINYFVGEIDKETLIIDSFKIMKIQQIQEQEEFKKEIEEKRIFTKVRNKNYWIAETKAVGYTLGVEERVTVEKYLIDGNIQIRARNSKGQFASFVKLR